MFEMLEEMRLGRPGHRFSQKYKCFSSSLGQLSHAKSQDIEKGGKIILPPSALDQLSRLNISYPMLFKVTNTSNGNRSTHCGVLEFVAEEGHMFLPYWMMQNLLTGEGELLQIENCTLPTATYARFRPQSTDFHDISNPKAVLENALRNFACLTKGDVIAIQYNNRQYELFVVEVKPDNAVCIIECDISLEFEAPLGFNEKEKIKESEPDAVVGTPDMKKAIEEYMKEKSSFTAFDGVGVRLDGKKKNTKLKKSDLNLDEMQRGIPNYKWEFGTITFNRMVKKPNEEMASSSKDFVAFEGQGNALRKKRIK